MSLALSGPTSLSDALAAALAVQPDAVARELLATISRQISGVDKTDVNGTLYGDPGRFWNDGGTPPRWRLIAGHPPADSTGPPSFTAPALVRPRTLAAVRSVPELYKWQREALESWRQAGRQAVVEAVTGTGKTIVGIAAVGESLTAGGKVVVIVPTVELLRQWTVSLRSTFPGRRIGKLGDGGLDSFAAHDIVVAVVNSARMYDLGNPPRASLLVADECHRYGSESNAQALDQRFAWRLGLSATYERSDDGNQAHLDPYFHRTCFRMDYRRAIDDGVTARFKVALVGVRFDAVERAGYDDANRKANEAQRWLINSGLVKAQPFGEFMRDVNKLAEGGAGRATSKARSFLSNFAERRRILAETSAKRARLADLRIALAAANRTIVFTQTVTAAEDAATIVQRGGLSAEAIHSKLDPNSRRRVLGAFADGHLRVITAPQVLDEGIDVPAADLAVILASSRTQRQMIQRMGRVLRRKTDGRLARFVVLYVEGSSEDPAQGAHGDFLDEITSVAEEVRRFSASDAGSVICDYLNDFVRGTAQGTLTTGPTEGRHPNTGLRTTSPGGRSSMSPSTATATPGAAMPPRTPGPPSHDKTAKGRKTEQNLVEAHRRAVTVGVKLKRDCAHQWGPVQRAGILDSTKVSVCSKCAISRGTSGTHKVSVSSRTPQQPIRSAPRASAAGPSRDIEQLFVECRKVGIQPPTSAKKIVKLTNDRRVQAVLRLPQTNLEHAAQACKDYHVPAFTVWLDECLSPGFARKTRTERTASRQITSTTVRTVAGAVYNGSASSNDRSRRFAHAKISPHRGYENGGAPTSGMSGDAQEGPGRISTGDGPRSPPRRGIARTGY